MYANKNIKLGIKIVNKINISKLFFFEKYQDNKHYSISYCCFLKMYLLLLMLLTNEKWINISHVFMLDLLIIARYVRRFRRERERRLVEREEEIERLQQDIERREEDLKRRTRAVSPLNDRKRRAELFASCCLF